MIRMPRQSGATMPHGGFPTWLQSGSPSLRSQQRMVLDFGPVDRPSSPEDFSSQLAHEIKTVMPRLRSGPHPHLPLCSGLPGCWGRLYSAVPFDDVWSS